MMVPTGDAHLSHDLRCHFYCLPSVKTGAVRGTHTGGAPFCNQLPSSHCCTTWHVLAGSFATCFGCPRQRAAPIAMEAPDIWFISWRRNYGRGALIASVRKNVTQANTWTNCGLFGLWVGRKDISYSGAGRERPLISSR